MNTFFIVALTIITLWFAVARFIVPVTGEINKKDFFKDAAHIWVGILIGVSFYQWELCFLPIGITIVEVIAFNVRKKRP